MHQGLTPLTGTPGAKARSGPIDPRVAGRCCGRILEQWHAIARQLAGVLAALAFGILSGCVGAVSGSTPLAFAPPLDFSELLRATRAYQTDPHQLIEKVVARRAKLVLLRYEGLPERLHQIGRTDDWIDFICIDRPSFSEGPTIAQIVRVEPGEEGSVTYWLSGCGDQAQ